MSNEDRSVCVCVCVCVMLTKPLVGRGGAAGGRGGRGASREEGRQGPV